jgi:hypothetical protein
MSTENSRQAHLSEEKTQTVQDAEVSRRRLLTSVVSAGLAGAALAAVSSPAFAETAHTEAPQQSQIPLVSRVLYFNVFSYGNAAVESFGDLVSAAHGSMQTAGLTSITDHGWWVDGLTPVGHSIIAFVGGTAQNTNAVVISAGDDGLTVNTQLVTLLKNVKFL